MMGEPVVLHLGMGFLAIYVVDLLASGARGPGRWWRLRAAGAWRLLRGRAST